METFAVALVGGFFKFGFEVVEVDGEVFLEVGGEVGDGFAHGGKAIEEVLDIDVLILDEGVVADGGASVVGCDRADIGVSDVECGGFSGGVCHDLFGLVVCVDGDGNRRGWSAGCAFAGWAAAGWTTAGIVGISEVVAAIVVLEFWEVGEFWGVAIVGAVVDDVVDEAADVDVLAAFVAFDRGAVVVDVLVQSV